MAYRERIPEAWAERDRLERLSERLDRAGWPARYALAPGITALVTLILARSGLAIEAANLSLIYLVAVLGVASVGGAGPGVAASVLSFLAYNFFFVEPLYVLTVANPQDAVRLVVFLVAALLASNLTGRLRHRAALIRRRTGQLEALYRLSQSTGAVIELRQILPEIAATTLALLHAASCTLTVQSAGGERTESAVAPEATASTHGGITAPVRVGDRVLGRLIVEPRRNQRFDPDERRLTELLALQAGLAVQREQLASEAAEREALAAENRFKATLLSSLSHDLRSPLTVITGVATSLQQPDASWDRTHLQPMLATLSDEAARLNRIVGNLLEMSRIESGALERTRDWEDLGELVGAVLARLRPRFGGRAVTVEMAEDAPLVWLNAALIDQVLSNLLENVLRHTPATTPVTIQVRASADEAIVEILDRGPGIPEALLPRLFGKFVRGAAPERAAQGTGLGLAICKGIIEAHGGRIWAANRPDGGALFGFALPRNSAQPDGSGQPPGTVC